MKYTVLCEQPTDGVALVSQWHVAIGGLVQPNVPLLTLSCGTEECVVSAPTHGVLFKKCVLVGEAVEAGEPLAVLAGVVGAPSPRIVAPPTVAPWSPLAAHMAESLRYTPHITTTLSVTLSEIKRLQSKAKFSSVIPFFLAAIAIALTEYPALNRGAASVDLAVVLETPEFPGILVPVVSDAEQKSIAALARLWETLPQQPQGGGSFTVTVGRAQTQTPILHYPNVGHLYLGLPEGTETATLCLATDATAVGSFEATRFLEAIQKSVECASFLFF